MRLNSGCLTPLRSLENKYSLVGFVENLYGIIKRESFVTTVMYGFIADASESMLTYTKPLLSVTMSGSFCYLCALPRFSDSFFETTTYERSSRCHNSPSLNSEATENAINDLPAGAWLLHLNRPFYRYGGHFDFYCFERHYGMFRGQINLYLPPGHPIIAIRNNRNQNGRRIGKTVYCRSKKFQR